MSVVGGVHTSWPYFLFLDTLKVANNAQEECAGMKNITERKQKFHKCKLSKYENRCDR